MATIAAVVLAAGASRRHPQGDKLMRAYRGAPLVAHCLDSVAAAGFAEFICVVRDSDCGAAEEARRRGYIVVVNENADAGVGASIAAGVKQIDDAIDAAAIFLGDMPHLSVATVKVLIEEFERRKDASILRPVYRDTPGHPVFFARRHFSALSRLSGDDGAKMIVRNSDDILTVSVEDSGVVDDVDTDEAFGE
ncbi:MAG TPA: nucleotidyltransferase family protein [Parvularculaceae bacterium]|nr:nucleotidyltransferase family protein [Parvularculaceae bacterium]